MTKWAYRDGGKSNCTLPDIESSKDCTVRALALASGRTYEECWAVLDKAEPGGIADGAYQDTIDQVYSDFGFKLLPYRTQRSVGEVVEEHPNCIMLLVLPNQDSGACRRQNEWSIDVHTMAVRRGRMLDTKCPKGLYKAAVCAGVYIKRRNRRVSR